MIAANILRLEKSHHTDDVLTTNRALAENFAATGACGHVAAFEQNTLDRSVHADFAKIVGGQFLHGYAKMKKKSGIRQISLSQMEIMDDFQPKIIHNFPYFLSYMGNFAYPATAVALARAVRSFHSIL